MWQTHTTQSIALTERTRSRTRPLRDREGKKMDLNRISTTIKDTSRAIYIQLLAGKVADSEQLKKDIKEIENALVALKALIALEQSGYSFQPNQVSDLKGLAQREQM